MTSRNSSDPSLSHRLVRVFIGKYVSCPSYPFRTLIDKRASPLVSWRIYVERPKDTPLYGRGIFPHIQDIYRRPLSLCLIFPLFDR